MSASHIRSSAISGEKNEREIDLGDMIYYIPLLDDSVLINSSEEYCSKETNFILCLTQHFLNLS